MVLSCESPAGGTGQQELFPSARAADVPCASTLPSVGMAVSGMRGPLGFTAGSEAWRGVPPGDVGTEISASEKGHGATGTASSSEGGSGDVIDVLLFCASANAESEVAGHALSSSELADSSTGRLLALHSIALSEMTTSTTEPEVEKLIEAAGEHSSDIACEDESFLLMGRHGKEEDDVEEEAGPRYPAEDVEEEEEGEG